MVRYAGEPDRFAGATTLLNVAASVRNAARLAGSLTFECSITFEEASRGSPSAGPISTRPGGAIRRASGATARPAKAAAATAVTPPPTKRSLQAMPALSRARTASARTPQGGASVASGSVSPRRQAEALGGEPAEGVLRQLLAAAAAAFLPHHHGIEFAGIVGVQHLARKADRHGQRQLRRHRVQPFEQRHQFRPRGVIGDPERQLLARGRLARQRAVMGFHQRAGVEQERRALGGQRDRPRRALDQPLAEHALQPLQLHADGRLRRAQRLGGAGKALQFGDQQERLHGIDIQRAHAIIRYIVITVMNRDKIPK